MTKPPEDLQTADADSFPPGMLRTFVRHVQALEVGDAEGQIDMGDPTLAGGFLLFNEDGDVDERWIWIPRSIFLSNYQEVS